MSRINEYDADRLYSEIENLVWQGVSWDTIRKEAASCYQAAMERHAKSEIKEAGKEFSR